MQETKDDFKAYIKSILIWGLPGLYVAIALYLATLLMSGIRVH